MKRSDIYTLILIAGIGTLVAFLLCGQILGDPNDAKVEFQALKSVISNELANPDEEIFNDTAINPTIEVYVGDCEDIDRNGMLDKAELVACGREQAVEEDEETTETNSETDTENNTADGDETEETSEGE